MRGLIQRVSRASVHVGQENVGEISRGLVLLLGIEKADTSVEVDKLLNKTLSYRVFPDEKNHMNLSLLDIVGELLVVSQFTLAADTKKGLRPSFSSAAQPDIARALYDEFVTLAQSRCATSTGEFGADMQVELVNDGPVTFLLTS